MNTLRSTCIALLLTGPVTPQPVAPGLAFEVASVKSVETPAEGIPPQTSIAPIRNGDRLRWTQTLSQILRYAFNLPARNIQWVNRDESFYAIEAVLSPSATERDMRIMLQTLLIDRFNLAAHHEQRQSDGYALLVSKSGLKVNPANAADVAPAPHYMAGASLGRLEGRIFTTLQGNGIRAITGRRVSMSALAQSLSDALEAPVWDRTEREGNYYFGFLYAPVPQPEVDAPSLATALQDELGLRLGRQKGTSDFLIVDRIAAPSEN